MHRRRLNNSRLTVMLMKNRSGRNKKGILGSTMLVAFILIMMCLMCLGVDYSHLVSTRTQLRNAADAAAMAGAYMLYEDPSQCDEHAIQVAEQCVADGLKLQNVDGVVAVTVNTTAPNGGQWGRVEVTIDYTMDEIIGPMFNRFDDHIIVRAVAGGTGRVVRPYEGIEFPLAISLNATPGNGPGNGGNAGNGKGGGKQGNGNGNNENAGAGISLLDAINGENKTFHIYINSQQYKNGAFTSLTVKNANANWLSSAIAQSLDIQDKRYEHVTIPAAGIGDEIYVTNGLQGQKQLADEPFFSKLTDGRIIVLPVFSGDPAYVQTMTVIGFVTVKIRGVTTNGKKGEVETLTAELVDAAIPGISGNVASTGNQNWDQALAQVNPKVYKMLE